MRIGNIDIPFEKIEGFCRKWSIQKLSVFGSVLRDDFRPDSDVDVLVRFEDGAMWGWEIVDMRDELEAIFHRPVDLVTEKGLRNPFRRHEILTTRQVVYAA